MVGPKKGKSKSTLQSAYKDSEDAIEHIKKASGKARDAIMKSITGTMQTVDGDINHYSDLPDAMFKKANTFLANLESGAREAIGGAIKDAALTSAQIGHDIGH